MRSAARDVLLEGVGDFYLRLMKKKVVGRNFFLGRKLGPLSFPSGEVGTGSF